MLAGSSLGQPIRLRSILPTAQFLGAQDLFVSGCSHDSRTIRPGELFVAMAGENHNGTDYIAEAIQRGASGVIAAAPCGELAVPLCVVADPADAFGRICQAIEGDPSRHVKVIGITGTNGKTTTSFLIASVLAAGNHPTGIIGTLGCFDGLDWRPSSWTTPPANVLARRLAEIQANGCTHAVMEVSSHSLAQSRVAGVAFDAACVTNVQHDHLDYHRTMADYRLSKSKLFNHLTPDGFSVVNADDPTAAGFLHTISGPALTIAIRAAAEITATPIEHHLSEQTFLLIAGSDAIPVRTRMIGEHHIYNCLTAAAVGLAYGVNLTQIVRGLEAVESVPGRLQRLECGQPFGVFVDFAHTPDALAVVLRTLRETTSGRLICLFGAGGDRDREKRPEMARQVERYADRVVVTSDNPRTENPEIIAADLLGGFESTSGVEIMLDRAKAIAWALSQAEPGDCVLLAGKGHEKTQIIGDRAVPFDDAEVARRWLYRHAAQSSLIGPTLSQ